MIKKNVTFHFTKGSKSIFDIVIFQTNKMFYNFSLFIFIFIPPIIVEHFINRDTMNVSHVAV